MRAFGVVLVLSWICVIVTSNYCGPWIPISNIKKANENDTIEIYYLVAALLECDENGTFALVNGYHSGIGLTNVNQNISISVNFDAYPTFLGALVPDIIYRLDGTPRLQWSTLGKVFIYDGINTTYWSYGSDMIGKINGNIFNSYMDWVMNYNSTTTDSKYYQPWSVYTHYPMQPWDTQWVASHECFSFAWESFRIMVSYGARFSKMTAKQSVVAVYTSSQPTLVDMNNPLERRVVETFYQYLAAQVDKYGTEALAVILSELIANDLIFLYIKGNYYKIQTWEPYVDALYVEVPLPPYDTFIK